MTTPTQTVDATAGAHSPLMPDLFHLAMQQSAVAMCLVSVEGRLVEGNEATADLLGVRHDELSNLTFQQVTHPDDLAKDLSLFEQVKRGEIDSYRVSKRYLRPDGSTVYGDLTVTGVRDGHGELLIFLGQIVDVTAQTRFRRDSQATREQLRGVIDSLLDPWVLLGAVRTPDGNIVDFVYLDANDAACRMNRRSREELMGARLMELLPGHEGSGLLARYGAVVESGEPLVLDDFPYPSELTDGALRWFDNRAVKVGDGLSFTWRDVTERVEARQQLALLASSDPLTGLANRHSLMDGIANAIGANALKGARIAILYCDLDGFKAINDTFGHHAGDLVLRAVADRIRGAVREGDVVARIGGDEFVVLAHSIRDEGSAELLADKVARAVHRPVTYTEAEIVPTVSIGVSVGGIGSDAQNLLRLADRALYREKATRGRALAPGSVPYHRRCAD